MRLPFPSPRAIALAFPFAAGGTLEAEPLEGFWRDSTTTWVEGERGSLRVMTTVELAGSYGELLIQLDVDGSVLPLLERSWIDTGGLTWTFEHPGRVGCFYQFRNDAGRIDAIRLSGSEDDFALCPETPQVTLSPGTDERVDLAFSGVGFTIERSLSLETRPLAEAEMARLPDNFDVLGVEIDMPRPEVEAILMEREGYFHRRGNDLRH